MMLTMIVRGLRENHEPTIGYVHHYSIGTEIYPWQCIVETYLSICFNTESFIEIYFSVAE